MNTKNAIEVIKEIVSNLNQDYDRFIFLENLDDALKKQNHELAR